MSAHQIKNACLRRAALFAMAEYAIMPAALAIAATALLDAARPEHTPPARDINAILAARRPNCRRSRLLTEAR